MLEKITNMDMDTLNKLLDELKLLAYPQLHEVQKRWQKRTKINTVTPTLMDLAEQLAIERDLLNND